MLLFMVAIKRSLKWTRILTMNFTHDHGLSEVNLSFLEKGAGLGN